MKREGRPDGRQPTRREVLRTMTAGAVALAAGPDWKGRAGGDAEILVRGGRVVNASGVREADVRIIGERVAEIGQGLRAAPGARVIEAAGHLVMPGGIDPHTHLQPPFADNFTTGTEAALAGGITTVGTFAFARGDESPLAAATRLAGVAGRDACANVILHGGA